MFNNYDISLITRNKSRSYFEDVLQSYYSKNYRAAILLLYSLTIDDLYDKLILMNEKRYYNLNEELKQIDELNKKEKYSEIETKIYQIYKDKAILNHDTIDLLDYFKKTRNKCAHPTYFKEQNDTPLQEEVNLFIVKIYHDILTKEAFIKDPYSIIKPDIENREWGSLIDILSGFEKHEMHYIPFKKFFTTKYLKKFTDNNLKKLFSDLIKIIILKNGEWEKLNQYTNMMLMESLLEYLYENGKMQLLVNHYDWIKLQDETLYDDNKEVIFENEWFGLTNLYKILTYNHFFIEEIRNQNELIYQHLQKQIVTKVTYITEFGNLFYQDINEICEKINNIEIQKELLKQETIVSKKYAIIFLENIFEDIPYRDGFSLADEACELLITGIINYHLTNQDIKKVLDCMNHNTQIYYTARKRRDAQLDIIRSYNIDLSSYDNLK